MSHDDDKVVDFARERSSRIHDLKERRLAEMQQAFERAFPMPASGKKKATAGKGKRKPRKK